MGCKAGSSPPGTPDPPGQGRAAHDGKDIEARINAPCCKRPSEAEGRGWGGRTKPKSLHLIDGKQFKPCFSAVRGALIPGMT